AAEKFTEDGWLRTGDVAELRHGSYIQLIDRTKDLVKSGGEWISSVELENHLMAHPDVLEAAVVAVPDERWGERPCACVVTRDGASLDAEAALADARPALQALGAALGPERHVLLVAGNHDHRLVAPWLERRRAQSPPLAADERVSPAAASGVAETVAGWLAPARVEVAYP